MSASTYSHQMILKFIEIPDWPKLGWAAVFTRNNPEITIFHGPNVETSSSWCVEAVWDGDFVEGDFDRTDLVCGTGVRVRGCQVFFVSSGDTFNRLYWYQDATRNVVSNSLPVLLVVGDIDLLEEYPYADALASVANGLKAYQREIPSTGGVIRIVYFHNLLFENGEVIEVPKLSSPPDFIDFKTYRDYLFESAKRVTGNASSTERKYPVKSLATLSSGYDSCAAAVVAKEVGVTKAVTISEGRRDASNLFSLNDSGAHVAEQLGLHCTSYTRTHKNYLHEDSAWASMGSVGDAHFAIFDYPKPLCLLFTGFLGDTFWDKNTIQSTSVHNNRPVALNELRLELGFFICAPAFWGCKNEEQILRLSHLPEMRPWLLGNNYDRPIPRRLLEEEGVKRGTFATKKRLASFNRRFGRPLSVDLRSDFAKFLAERGMKPGSLFSEKLSLFLSGIDWLILRKLPERWRFSCKNWIELPSPALFFLWANRRLKQRYQQALIKANSL